MSEKVKNPAAVALGSIKSEKKAQAARENAKLPRRRGRKPLESIPCTCGLDTGDTVTMTGHKSRCVRGRAIQRRAATKS